MAHEEQQGVAAPRRCCGCVATGTLVDEVKGAFITTAEPRFVQRTTYVRPERSGDRDGEEGIYFVIPLKRSGSVTSLVAVRTMC